MAINFGNNSTQNYASTVIATYYNMVTTTYDITGSTNETVIWTGGNRSLPGSNCEHIIHASLDVAGAYGGAYSVQYSTNGGSSWNGVGTADLGSVDNGSGMNIQAMGSWHQNFDGNGAYNMLGNGFFWKYDPNTTQSRLRIQMTPYNNSSHCTLNRRQYDTSFNSISHIIEYIVQDS
jgi:hypothetical protein